MEIKEYMLDCGRGVSLHTAEAGCGSAIICLHGGASSWKVFKPQMAVLAEKFRVIAPDLRGHGDSPWPSPSSIDDFYEDLCGFIEALKLPGKFVLAGHSLGGCLASRYAAEYPDKVAGLVLLNTSGSLPNSLASNFFRLFSSNVDNVRRHFPWLVNTNSQVATCLTDTIFPQWDVWRFFPLIKSPTWAVLGTFDPLIPLAHGRKMVKMIPRSKLTVLPLGGHVSLIDRPNTVAKVIYKMASRQLPPLATTL